MDLSLPYYSFGTIYGTVQDYDNAGNVIGRKDITGYGLFFSVKSMFAPNGTRIIFKEIGTGINIEDGANGCFNITLQTKDLNQRPAEYAWGCFLNPLGTSYSEGTTDVKWIGGGKFTIEKGIKI